MKKTLKFLAAAALVAFAAVACQKEQFSDSSSEGEETVTFTVQTDAATTKASADGDGLGVGLTRCLVAVYMKTGDALTPYKLYDTPATTKTDNEHYSFTVNLIRKQSYQIVVWADKGKYTVSDDLSSVTRIADDFACNSDAYDAFYASTEFVQGTTTSTAITAKRPFAQLNLITKDLRTGFEPKDIELTYTVDTKFNPFDGTTSDPQLVTYKSTPHYYTTLTVPGENTVAMNYLFANDEQSVLNEVKLKATFTDAVELAVANVPVRRNYRTNIKGNLFTEQTDYTITVDANWNTPAIEVAPYNVNSPAQVQTALETKAADITADGKDANVTVTDFDASENTYQFVIPDEITASNTPAITFRAEDVPAGKTLVVTDETIGDASKEYDGKVTLVTNAETVVVKTSQSHFELVGNANVVYANTSDDTFVVPAGYTVENLVVEKGRVAIEGTVKNITRSEDNPDAISLVDIYGSGNWVNEETQKSETLVPRHPSIVVGDKVFLELQKAFDAAEENDVIRLVNNVGVYSTSSLSTGKNVTLDLAGYTMTVYNNNGDGLVIENGSTLNLTNSIAEHGTYEFVTNNSRNDGIFVYNTEEGKTTTLNINDPVKLVCNSTAQNSTVHAYAPAGKAVVNLNKGAEFIVRSNSGRQITAVYVDANAEFNMNGGVFDMKVDFSRFSYSNDVVGVLLMGYSSYTNVVNINGGYFSVGGSNAFAQGVQIGYNNGSNPGNKVNINGGEIHLAENPGGLSFSFTMAGSGTYNVTGGKFTRDASLNDENSELFIYQFSSGNRVVSITGGEYYADPSAYVPQGYAATEGADGIWRVSAVSTAE